MTSSAPRLPMLAATVAVAACLGFAVYTGHVWEDYFITFRSSLNLATGHGLVYQPGERVHTFTSPLGTLLPAVFALGGGDGVVSRALWCFRLLSAAALGAALWLATRTMLRAGAGQFVAGAAAALWALDPKTIDFAINGQEAALMIFFVVLTWHALVTEAPAWQIALGCAGLQWTRPDGGVFFTALAVAWLALSVESERGARLRRLIGAVGLGFALYLPWLIFAWVYYGSPVPHTMLAKVSHYVTGELGRALLFYPWRLLFGHTALHDLFMPAYFYFGGWPGALAWVSRLLAVGAALAWAWPAVRPAGRVASVAFFLGGFYVEYLPRSPWYYPAWQALAFLAWAFLLDAAWRAAPRGPGLVRVFVSTLIGLQLALILAVAWQMRTQQAIIEDGQRTAVGRWLRAHAAPGENVYLEPLGYIGFFSNLKMLDYPGLASPEVVAARRAGAQPHASIIAALRPNWLVLRPDQMDSVRAEQPRLLIDVYRLVRVFDVRAALDAVAVLPGRGYPEFDAVYFVFARTGAHDGRPP